MTGRATGNWYKNLAPAIPKRSLGTLQGTRSNLQRSVENRPVKQTPKVLVVVHFQSCKTLSDADVWDGLHIFHEWITIDFRDKLSYGNPRVSGGGQVNHDRTGKMLSRKISGKWASAGTRLKRLRMTGGAGGIVLPNASDAGWTSSSSTVVS